MYRLFGALALLATAAVATANVPPTASAAPAAEEAALKAHVTFLASDAMKGREAGSPEYDAAARYVAAQFQAAGLQPAGDAGGYLQQVPLVGYRAAGPGDFVLLRGGAPHKLTFGIDYVPAANSSQAETGVSAPVVFAGYGVVARGRNDYAGADVRGRIVAVMAGAPETYSPEERAFLGSPERKARTAGERGAAGVILLTTPASEDRRPFTRSVEGYQGTRMTWVGRDGAADRGQAPLLGTLSLAGAAKLFGGSGTTWQAAVAAAMRKRGSRASLLPGTLAVATRTTIAPVRSSNVVGILRGSDRALAAQTVVLSAHLDHIGISDRATNGDVINNGALDNAIGVASLIEEAKRFRAAGAPPRRSILFLAVTAEEKGLVGSDYFAAHPTVPAGSIVADVNLDMPILTYRFEDMVAFGGDRSTLVPIIRRTMAGMRIALSPDPIPEEGIFVRSDHFRFVERGIPSVFLWPGKKGPGAAAIDQFLATRYHRPSDDLTQPILWDQGVRFVEANYRIARAIADAPAPPRWNKGDYFGTLFKGPMVR